MNPFNQEFKTKVNDSNGENYFYWKSVSKGAGAVDDIKISEGKVKKAMESCLEDLKNIKSDLNSDEFDKTIEQFNNSYNEVNNNLDKYITELYNNLQTVLATIVDSNTSQSKVAYQAYSDLQSVKGLFK